MRIRGFRESWEQKGLLVKENVCQAQLQMPVYFLEVCSFPCTKETLKTMQEVCLAARFTQYIAKLCPYYLLKLKFDVFKKMLVVAYVVQFCTRHIIKYAYQGELVNEILPTFKFVDAETRKYTMLIYNTFLRQQSSSVHSLTK